MTRAETYALPFIFEMAGAAEALGAQMVFGADGVDAQYALAYGDVVGEIVPCQSRGYLESVHDEVLRACRGDYVLRLDDDERMSPAMTSWIERGTYASEDHWKFPRVHLWGNRETILRTPHLFPDHQTRLSVRSKAGGRSIMHCGSPFGGGCAAPVVIEHHKFLVKSREQRAAIAATYDRFSPGFGTGGMLPFSLPEDAYDDAYLRGSLVPYFDHL